LPTSDLIDSWVEKSDINLLFNARGTKYRTLKLKELNLDDNGKCEWLKKEPMLLKRPLVEYDEKVLVAFNEEIYKETFL
jgi:arsenate reductase (glutaredoxin)